MGKCREGRMAGGTAVGVVNGKEEVVQRKPRQARIAKKVWSTSPQACSSSAEL